jgi:Tfp pilus assembly pilus retraction ATPase PilT
VKEDKENNNGLVFVYGNTGTGKTYTMGLIDELNVKSKGIVP